jgi:nicotinamide riboside transporter PnuC
MKLILTILLLLFSPLRTHAGWFDSKDQQQRIEQQDQQLADQRKSTGTWQIIAGAATIGAVILFTVGTAIGSTIRRHGKAK